MARRSTPSPASPPDARGLLERAADPFGLARAVWDRVDPSKRRGRRVWRGPGRVHLGVPGVVDEAGEELARAVEKALAAHPGVEWASVNAVLGVVVVALAAGEGDDTYPEDADPALDEVVDDLIDLVEILEEREEQDGVRRHPAAGHSSTAVAQAVTALAADIAGLGVAGIGRLLRTAPLPVELASVASFVDHQPRLRAAVERAMGRQRADVLLALTNAAAQALGQGSSGLLVDAAYRALQVAEVRSRDAAWSGAEPRLLASAEHAVAVADDAMLVERPVPLPLGPVERHGDQVGVAALGGFAGTLGVSGSPRRAAGVALSTLPKAGRMGREGFATTFSRVLAKRGALVVEPTVLRRMDRIDTVVLDAEALTTGVLMLGDLVAVPDADGVSGAPADLVPRVHELFDPSGATLPRRLTDGGEHWLLAALDDLPAPARTSRRGSPSRPAMRSRPTAPPTSSDWCATTGSSPSWACCPSRRRPPRPSPRPPAAPACR